jgi:hypothetical protein
MTPQLYIYRCKACGTTAAASVKAPYGQPWRCCLCRSMLTFQYAIPIETAEHRSWAARGIVYNPGASKDPVVRPTQAG